LSKTVELPVPTFGKQEPDGNGLSLQLVKAVTRLIAVQ